MKAIKRPDHYLRLRDDIWHYVRRVPKAVSHIDDRILIYHSLDTDSRKVARQRRDICADADEQRWHEIVPGRFQSTPREVSFRNVSHHARSLGFNYEPMDSLVSRDTVTDLLHRLQALGPLQDAPQPKEERDADVLLGVAKKPSATITEAMDLYLSEIVADELSSKSPEQVKNFSKIKRRAVANFVNINGDIDMRDITCEHAHAVRKFWHERIHPKDGSKPMSGSSGNKDLGSLRKLYRRYFEHIGEEERENPFRNMRFKDKILTKVMPFKNEWVRSRILAPDVFDGLNRQGALLCMALIETGCRPSALANIKPENIRLDAEVPHIRIRPTKDRELKSGASVRDIPLVGVALEAMRQRAAHERSHRLRLEALTKAGVVTAVEYSPRDGRALAWQVPEDFESQAIALDLKQGRASGVTLLSVQDLNAQLASPGATWLDRAQVGWNKIEKVSAPQSVFTKEVKEAFRQRQEWLVERGHADVSHESDGKNYVTNKRGYVKALETEGFDAATQKIEGQTGKPFVAAQAGRLLEGTVSQKFELPHGPDAMIETQRAFYLVPWQSVHAQTWGKRIRGRVLSGGGIDWDAGRARGIGR